MELQKSIALAPYTTFGIGGPAQFFCVVNNLIDLKQALAYAKKENIKYFVLGGGSNILVSDNGFSGLVLCIQNLGITFEEPTKFGVIVKISAGEIWDHVVAECVQHGLWGLENLSHIPGRSGAFVVQNVGAYGQEASQIIKEVEVFDTTDEEIKVLLNSDCDFNYRSSIFNREQKNRYIILSITLQLSEAPKPNLSYGDIAKYFEGRQADTIDQAEIRSAVIQIRNKKFPFPTEAKGGSAGSFFRGPLLSSKEFFQLQTKISEKFSADIFSKFQKMTDRLKVSNGYKTPAGFLIDICGLKGFSVGGAKINETQAAVVINATGKATAEDILSLYQEVQTAVFKKTGVRLEHEPEFVGFDTMVL